MSRGPSNFAVMVNLTSLYELVSIPNLLTIRSCKSALVYSRSKKPVSSYSVMASALLPTTEILYS